MHKLKLFSVNTEGLKLFYFAMIRSILIYGSPVFYSVSKRDQSCLESVQKTASRLILPFVDGYENRLQQRDMPSLHGFIQNFSRQYFNNRNNTVFNPPLCQTAKYKNCFFPFFTHSFEFFSNFFNCFL